MPIGIVAPSYGVLKDGGAGKSNEKLAFLADKFHEKNGWETYVQIEVASAMKSTPRFVVTKHRQEGQYLVTEEVITQIIEQMKKDGVTEVLLLAHLFIHRFQCKRILKKYGLKVKIIHFWDFADWWIPFCKNSAQWYTKGPIRATIYVLRYALTGKRG